jgi:hypothetical protein
VTFCIKNAPTKSECGKESAEMDDVKSYPIDTEYGRLYLVNGEERLYADDSDYMDDIE